MRQNVNECRWFSFIKASHFFIVILLHQMQIGHDTIAVSLLLFERGGIFVDNYKGSIEHIFSNAVLCWPFFQVKTYFLIDCVDHHSKASSSRQVFDLESRLPDDLGPLDGVWHQVLVAGHVLVASTHTSVASQPQEIVVILSLKKYFNHGHWGQIRRCCKGFFYLVDFNDKRLSEPPVVSSLAGNVEGVESLVGHIALAYGVWWTWNKNQAQCGSYLTCQTNKLS